MPITISGGVTLNAGVVLTPGSGGGSSTPSLTYGFNAAGEGTGTPSSNIIDKFAFASLGNATDVGDLSTALKSRSSSSSSTSGYLAGGTGSPSLTTIIQKFSFTTDGNGSLVGNLSVTPGGAGAGNSSLTDGYTHGGDPTNSNIQKMSFASESGGTTVAYIMSARRQHVGQNSSTHGYLAGGNQDPGNLSRIEKYPFASDDNSTNVGDLTTTRDWSSGQSSSDHGYISGGNSLSSIEKFTFSADNDSTSVANLSSNHRSGAGVYSATDGYACGGIPYTSSIDQFPFSSDSNASSVGNLTLSRGEHGGFQG